MPQLKNGDCVISIYIALSQLFKGGNVCIYKDSKLILDEYYLNKNQSVYILVYLISY